MKPDPIAASLARLLRNLGSDKSRRAYQDDWERYVKWLAARRLTPVKARPGDVEDHIQGLQEAGCKRSTCGRALSVIRAVYGILVRDEVCKTNPAREVKNPKFDSSPSTPHLTEDQVRQLFARPAVTWKERRARVCLSLLLGIGWRRSEVARMTVEDFRAATVTGMLKGKKLATVGVPEWVQREVAEWRAYAGIEAGALLPRSPANKAPIGDATLYDIVSAATIAAGIGHFSPHAFRRTKITIEGERGVSLKERQLAVGHASQATTERYDKANAAASSAPGQVLADLVGHKD